jgi:hypothetical protein
MNKALWIIVVPAVIVSAFWLAIGWGLRAAGLVTALEIAVIAGFLIYAKKRQGAGTEKPEAR